jgi:DNA gyrase inhibitor GyrI
VYPDVPGLAGSRSDLQPGGGIDPYEHQNGWRRARTEQTTRRLGSDTRSFGTYYDDPSATRVEALRSDACITVPDDWTPSGGDLI